MPQTVDTPRIAIAETGYDFIGRLLKKKFTRCIERAGGRAVWILGPGKGSRDLLIDFDGLASEFDGFLFPGGSDVDPQIYGAAVSPACGKLNPIRDHRHEPPMLRSALKHDKPVLGICRGFQLINAVMGGSLYQDLKTERPVSSSRHTRFSAFQRPVHEVTVTAGSLLAASVGSEQIEVNSVHHQAVAELSGALTATGVSDDGLIEGFESRHHRFLLGVQWHPEVLASRYPIHQNIFNAFVRAAKSIYK